MAFCEWMLLGNWCAVKHDNLVFVLRMIKDEDNSFLSTGAADTTRGICSLESLN